jgi:hypothetical protein
MARRLFTTRGRHEVSPQAGATVIKVAVVIVVVQPAMVVFDCGDIVTDDGVILIISGRA